MMLGITGFMGGKLNKNFSKESKMTIIIILSLLTFACETIRYLLQVGMFNIDHEILTYIKILGIEVLYNIIIVIIIYPLFQSSGRWLEKTFHEKKVYTTYY